VEQGRICLLPRIKEEDLLSFLLRRKSLISWTTKEGDYQSSELSERSDAERLKRI